MKQTYFLPPLTRFLLQGHGLWGVASLLALSKQLLELDFERFPISGVATDDHVPHLALAI